MIKTRTFALDRSTTSLVALRIALQQSGWIFIVLLVMSAGTGFLFGGGRGVLTVGAAWVLLLLLAGLFLFNPFLMRRNSGNNAIRLRYEFNEDQFITRAEKSGKSARVKWDTLEKASIISGTYVLRDADKGYYVIPFDAFHKEDDRARFEAILRGHELL